MSDLLIRGLPQSIHREIRELAKEQELSINQLLIRLIRQAIDYAEMKKDRKERQEKAFQRINEIREEIHKKHGLLDDSTKIIRERRGPIEEQDRM